MANPNIIEERYMPLAIKPENKNGGAIMDVQKLVLSPAS